MRRLLAFSCLFTLALVPATRADTPEPPPREPEYGERSIGSYLLRDIARAQRETWRWQRLMGKRRTPTSNSAPRSNEREYREWVLQLWRERARRARSEAQHPPHYRQWLCIKRYEGAWNDPNPPYFGGLQMDLTFQRQYGAWLLRRKGTADNWTPLEQMWVAERAYRSGRGFTPWPNTARFCGLL